MSYEDKENVYNEPLRQRRSADRDGNNLCKSSEKAESKRGFSRLLKDVTNSIRYDFDERVAEKVQDDDATSIINEWMSEQRGTSNSCYLCCNVSSMQYVDFLHQLRRAPLCNFRSPFVFVFLRHVDSRLAAKIAKDMEDDLKNQRRTELSQGSK